MPGLVSKSICEKTESIGLYFKRRLKESCELTPFQSDKIKVHNQMRQIEMLIDSAYFSFRVFVVKNPTEIFSIKA